MPCSLRRYWRSLVSSVGRDARSVESPEAIGRILDVHAQSHGFDACDEGQMVAAVALPAVLQTLFGDDGETLPQGIEERSRSRVVILVAGVKRVQQL
jgi:hypothetical protein